MTVRSTILPFKKPVARKARVLIVESLVTNQLIYKKLLAGLPLLVDVTGNSEQAIAKLEHEDIDLLILDSRIDNPPYNELVNLYRILRPTSHTPVLLTVQQEDFEPQVFVNDIIRTPVSHTTFILKVQTLLGRLPTLDITTRLAQCQEQFPFFDVSNFKSLNPAFNDPAEILALLNSFMTDLAQSLQRLAAVYGSGSSVDIENTLYAIKGNALQIGAQQIVALADLAMEAMKSANKNHLPQAIKAIHQCATKTGEEIRRNLINYNADRPS